MLAHRDSYMTWFMDTDVPSLKLNYFPPKSTGQMVFTSLREVGSCWQQGMSLAFGVATDFTDI